MDTYSGKIIFGYGKSRDAEVIQQWLNFSMKPRTEEEIELALKYNPDIVCVSYICKYSRLSEAFIEKLIVLTSGLLNKKNRTTQYDAIKRLCDAKYAGDKTAKDIITIEENRRRAGQPAQTVYVDTLCTIADVHDKIDWDYIATYQKLSDDFIRKYMKVLNRGLILHNQTGLSPELRKELAQKEAAKPSKIKTNKEIYDQVVKSIENDMKNDNFDEDEELKPKKRGGKRKKSEVKD